MTLLRSIRQPTDKKQLLKNNTPNNSLDTVPVAKSLGKAGSMAELMASFSSQIKSFKKGDIVEGFVKKLTPREITLDIGAKSDALVLEFDKQNINNLLRLLKVGDRVKASVISAESEEGFPVVSLRRTLDDIMYMRLETTAKKGEVIEVYVSEGTRGGFFVETKEGVKGFLPNSQVLSENLIGKTLSVKIIEFDRSKKRVIFSQKATMYVMDSSKVAQLLKKGDIVDTIIQHVTSHGLYTSIQISEEELIEGFIHISEVSYQRVDDLLSMFKKGDSIKAQVIDIDHEARRVNLSIKRLEKDTFEEIKKQYKKDQKVIGKVKSVRGRGITIALVADTVGFIPESKIPSDVSYKVGEEIEALVEDFDDRHRMVVLTPILKAKPIGYR